jgi:hypothetical protein
MALLRQFLSTVGDGTGTVNGAADGSSVAVNLKIVPASGVEYRLESLTVLLEDNAALVGDAFAGATMTNGIRIQVLNGDDVATLNVDAGLAIKRIADFLQLGFVQSGDSTQLAAGTNKFAAYKLTFASPVVLNGSTPTRLNVKIQDNLSGAVLLKVLAEGISRGQVTA